MSRFLLDTDICVFYLRGQFDLIARMEYIGFENCGISEITLAELQFGAEKSDQRDENHRTIDVFVSDLRIYPITPAIRLYAKEKARLYKTGKKIGDFDLLIGATAVVNDLELITNNTKHFERIDNIVLDNWIEK